MYDKGNYFECKHDRMKIFAQGFLISNKEKCKKTRCYRPQTKFDVFTCVCLSTRRRGGIPACIASGIPACLAAGGMVSQHALQQGGDIPACIAGGIPACLAAGGWYPSMHCRWYPSMPCSRGGSPASARVSLSFESWWSIWASD